MKKIAIVGHWTGGNSFGITKPYMHFWQHFGEVSLISPYEKEVRDIDLLVLPGGPDVDINRYLDIDEDIHIYTGAPRMEAERFDRMLLPKYIAKKTPIFCTCRGMQSLYVHFGGKLNQHMNHESNGDDRTKLVHGLSFENLNIIPGLQKWKNQLGNKEYKVNSIHHQTVHEETKPAEFTILARHSKDDEIEIGTFFPHYPAHTTQHHVEEIYDEFSILLIEHLLSLSDEE